MTDLAPAPDSHIYPPGPIPEADLWTHARTLFVDGVPGAAVCEALQLPQSTFWKRAAGERWLRRDNPLGAPEPEAVDFDQPLETREANAELAWRRMTLAAKRGRPGEALSWMRLHAAISGVGVAEARQEHAATMARLDAASQQARAIERAALAVTAADERMASPPPMRSRPAARTAPRAPVEKVECAPSHSTDRPLNRAERRRLMRSDRAAGPDP